MCIVPKLIDWFILLILLALELFVSSHPYELWRCHMHLCSGTPWGTSWMPLCYVFYMWNKQTSFNALLFMNLCFYPFMLQHNYFVLLLELHLSCSCLEYFDPSFQSLQMVWSWLWWCMSPQKLLFLFITYLLEDEQELNLGMLICC